MINSADIQFSVSKYSLSMYHFPLYKSLFGEEIPHTCERDRYPVLHCLSSFLTLRTQTIISNYLTDCLRKNYLSLRFSAL